MNQSIKKPFINGLIESHIDPTVYQDTLKTHAKEAISFIEYGNTAITNIDSKIISRVQFTECEISPFHKNELDCHAIKPASFQRGASACRFSEKKIAFTDITQLLVHAFAPNSQEHRPYPSAGGLYPVEPLVFLFKERMDEPVIIESGCYHFRAISKKLQLIKKLSTTYFFDKILHQFIDKNQLPCFVILYIAHLGKSIFKYRYRGYRHALMEAGSMYQQALLVSQEMGLCSTVWSTFSDHEILYEIELEYGTYLPLTMQLFGYGE